MAGVCDIPVVSKVCDGAGEVAGNMVAAPFEFFAHSLATVAQTMVEAMWIAFDTTTMVDITGAEYRDVYAIVFGIAVFVMLAFFMLQVIGSMIRREPAGLTRALLGLAKSILGSFVVLTLMTAALEITDQMCLGIIHAAGTNMSELGDRMALLGAGLGTSFLVSPGAGAVMTMFLASLMIIASFIVWISLLVRKALILVAIIFAPVALAGASWDVTRGWVGKWAAMVLALIFSKVVLVVIFLVATAQVSAPITTDLTSLSDPIAGVVLMMIAGFAPYMTYKAISFMGFDAYQSTSAEQEAKAALNRPIPVPLNRAGAQVSKVLSGNSGSSTTGGAGSGGVTPTAKAGGPGTAGPRTASGGTAGAGSAGGGTGAAGPVAAALVGAKVMKAAATAGPQLGHGVAGATSAQTQAATAQAPAPHPPAPRVADPIAGPGGGRS